MAKSMQYMVVSLHISADEYIAYYQGVASAVVATAEDGRTVRFPANLLQPFLTHQGISGRFVLSFDNNNKFKALKKIN